ncbi:hypothetical protein LCGC14_0679690 [marine sediment metagenome]|uniref:Uncharacterized protein n=1 Tax=marine sediment metagenome TaxID=412755 RepID=A0A0F9T9V1_9ZZZZ
MGELTVEQVEHLELRLGWASGDGRIEKTIFDSLKTIIVDWHRQREKLERLSNIINAAYDARGSDVFDILEGGIEKGPQP